LPYTFTVSNRLVNSKHKGKVGVRELQLLFYVSILPVLLLLLVLLLIIIIIEVN
jgi:hypothetical protein